MNRIRNLTDALDLADFVLDANNAPFRENALLRVANGYRDKGAIGAARARFSAKHKKAQAVADAQEALDLFAGGKSYKEIAECKTWTIGRVAGLVDRARKMGLQPS